MKNFLKELCCIEINNVEKCFNGFYSADTYTKYINELFSTADMTALTNELYLFATEKQLEDYMIMLDAYLPMYLETVQNMQHDAMISPYLKEEADWYQTLYEIRNAKEFYYNKFLEILNFEKQENTHQEKRERETQEDSNFQREYLTYEELIAKYNFKGVKSVKDKKWREKHNFYPCKQEGKGCALRISVSLLEEWLKGNNK